SVVPRDHQRAHGGPALPRAVLRPRLRRPHPDRGPGPLPAGRREQRRHHPARPAPGGGAVMTQTPEPPPRPVVEAGQVQKSFGDLHVLKGCDLTVHAGEVAVLVGPSGSGKSTLLRCINQLEEPSAGRVLIDGEVQGYRPDALPDGRWQKLTSREIAAQRSRI